MIKNVSIERNENESPTSVLRRFRSRVKSSGVLSKARALRYHGRVDSTFKAKKQKLRKLKRADEYERLYKLGKVS